jgi:hypothetical protein
MFICWRKLMAAMLSGKSRSVSEAAAKGMEWDKKETWKLEGVNDAYANRASI